MWYEIVVEMTNTRAEVDALHRSTKHGTQPDHPERLVRFRRLDPTNAPTPFKQYRDAETIPLPRHLVPSEAPATQILSGLSERGAQLDLSLLATLLFLTGGVTRVTTGPRGQTFFRTAMSAGNLHPIEIYPVLAPGFDSISEGVYHFAPKEFALRRLRRGDFRPVIGVHNSSALVITGIVWRTAWKYGERGWRHLYWDAGTMLANLLATADAHGIDARVHVGFDDAAVSSLVGIDGVDEMPLALVTLGTEVGWPDPQPDTPPLSLEVPPVAREPIRLPMVVEAQRAGELDADEVEGWLDSAAGVGPDVPSTVDPPGSDRHGTIESVILKRGSTRDMTHETIDAGKLNWPMSAATRAVPFDTASHGSLLKHFVNIHDVEEVDPGAYRWSHDRLELIGAAEKIREKSALLCLNQPLGGDSAYTVFHCCRLDALLDALGSRGYRAAQLEAGVVSGRLALCAFAVGLGATGLTFFDDHVSTFFQTQAAPMLVTSVGVPSAPPAPAGTPGDPAELGGYGDLMNRLMSRLQGR